MSFEPTSTDGLRRELAQAEVHLNHYLAERNRVDGEIARWQGVVERMKKVLDLMETPAQMKVRATNGNGKRRCIRWAKQWPDLLKDGQPVQSKRELIARIRVQYNLTEATANLAVNCANRKGDLVCKMDRMFLPTPPMPQFVKA